MMSSKVILLLQIAVCLHTTLCEDSTSWLSSSGDSTIPSSLCSQSFDIIYCANNELYIPIDYIMSTNSSSITIAKVVFGFHSRRGLKYPFICYREIPSRNINAFFCNFSHRQDYFCATCQDGYGIAMYTYYGLPCTPRCSDYGIVVYLMLEIGFSTLFFAFVFSSGMSANSSKWNGFIFYSQIVAIAMSTNSVVFTVIYEVDPHLPAILHSLYGIWNMDYFRLAISPFCVTKTISTLGALSCGYIAALWPLVLILVLSFAMTLHKRNIKVAVYLWHFIKRISCNQIQQHLAGTNLIHVFATFFLLSYLKAIYTSFSILQITVPLHLDMETRTLVPKRYLSADPHIPYFSLNHLAYAIPALVVVFILSVILPLLLVLYTTRCNTLLFRQTGRGWNALKTFIDAFQGSYKDGTNGTRDYRAVSALYVVIRLIIIVVYGVFFPFTYNSRLRSLGYLITAIVFIVLAGFFGLARPYKTKRHNLLDVLLHTLSAIQVICLYMITSYTQRSVVIILIWLVFLPIAVVMCATLGKLIISARIPKVL